MAYPQTLWDAIRAYWENTNAGYEAAAKAVSKGEDIPAKQVIQKRAVKEGWQKKYDGVTVEGDGGDVSSPSSQSLANINNSARKKADFKQAKGDASDDGLVGVITKNIHLSREEIDELCVDFRAGVLRKHRGDFNEANSVVNLCIQLFKKAMDIILEGGYVSDGDIVEKNGYVHQNLKQNLVLAEFTIKAMLNAAGVKNIAQTNERKSYGLETFEESTSSGELSKKAMSQTSMANHYERIRLSKPNEKQKMKDRLKGLVES